MDQAAGRRQEALCRDPRRRCAPRSRGRVIASSSCVQRQRLAGGDAQLPLDQIEAGDHLGHRMLDLQPRVHLHEVEAAVGMGDELDRARADVADRLRRLDRGLAHRARGARRSCRARALPRAPSGGVAAPSSRARTGRRSCRGVSAKTWISMWRGFSTYCSTSTRSSPNALVASRWHEASAAAKSSPVSTRRMPLPPPPALALISTGKPIFAGLAREQRRILVVAVIARRQRHAGLRHQRLGRGLRAHRADRRRPAVR